MILLNSKNSDVLRCDYIKNFIDTSTFYYKEKIQQKTLFRDGLCYIGYLWDCLLEPNIISEKEADQILHQKQKIYVMWDIHSSERILIPEYWKFPKSKVIQIDVWSETFKKDLPDDIYVFDNTLSWSVIYTHEFDEKDNRYCLFTQGDKTQQTQGDGSPVSFSKKIK